MPPAAVFVGVASMLVVGLACNMIAVLSSLADQSLDLVLLMRGDLSELIVYGPVWRLPQLPVFEQVVEWQPLLVVAVCGALLVRVGRRRRDLSSTWLAAFALCSGLVPYTVGALVLHDNAVAEHTGRWLVWMLHGPAYAALMALAFLVRGRLAGVPRDAVVTPASAAPSA